jgi:lipopolysaccharide export system permease protein
MAAPQWTVPKDRPERRPRCDKTPPMTGISRYVARQLLIGTALVSIVLVFIVWLTQSLRFLQFVMSKGLPLGTWLKLTVFMLPGFFSLILPIAFFFVVLFVYNKLSMDKELVVVQAAGMSRLGLAMPAILTAAGLTVATMILTTLIVPASVRGFKDLQWLIRTDVSQVLLREGAFNTLGQGLTIYVRGRSAKGELLDLMVDDARQAQKPITLLAARGVVVGSEVGSRVVLSSGSRQERQADGTLSILYFDSYTLDLGQLDPPPGTRTPDNRERGTWELLSLNRADGVDPDLLPRMRSEGHQRLALPLTVMGYALLAVTWLLTGAHDRRGQPGRIAGAVITVVALQAASLGAMNLTAKAAVLAPLMYLVALSPIVLCAYILARPPVKWLDALGGLRQAAH